MKEAKFSFFTIVVNLHCKKLRFSFVVRRRTVRAKCPEATAG